MNAIAQTLYDELKIHLDLKNEEEWIGVQINFLKNHHYHTAYSIRLREHKKKKYLEKLLKLF